MQYQFQLPERFSNRQFLTASDIVEITGRTRGLINAARARGDLRSVKLGGGRAIAFPVQDVIRFLSGAAE